MHICMNLVELSNVLLAYFVQNFGGKSFFALNPLNTVNRQKFTVKKSSRVAKKRTFNTRNLFPLYI